MSYENYHISGIHFDLSDNEKKEIILIYATMICKIWDYARKAIQKISGFYKSGLLDISEFNNKIEKTKKSAGFALGELCIEQYYNTGDANIFDRALMLDENVKLKSISFINLSELSKPYEEFEKTPITIFYNGFFFNLDSMDTKKQNDPAIKAIIRDDRDVERINRKLSRGRRILQIDEITLGKKYYDGLCMRTHFSKY